LVLLGKFYGFETAAMKERINAVYV
jgi:hypothetical protein